MPSYLNNHIPEKYRDEFVSAEHKVAGGATKVVPHWKHEHKPIRNVNKEFHESHSTLDRIAIAVTDKVGTFGFFLIILAWTVIWLGWNTVGPQSLRWDVGPAFVLWLFISNMLQIFLMPLLMVGQNLQGQHSELRAQADFEVNQKAEKEIEVILLHLEHQSAEIERQGELILDILRKIEPIVGPQTNSATPTA